MSIEDEVHGASLNFYAAINLMANGDSSQLTDIWSHSPTVTTMHPIGGREVGWDAVRESFEKVAQLASEGKVELRDQLIRVAGDVAYEAGVEHGRDALDVEAVALAPADAIELDPGPAARRRHVPRADYHVPHADHHFPPQRGGIEGGSSRIAAARRTPAASREGSQCVRLRSHQRRRGCHRPRSAAQRRPHPVRDESELQR